MEMLNKASELHRELLQQIKNILEQPVPFRKKTSLIVSKAADCIKEINLQLKQHRFDNEASEIQFFKEVLPEIYAKHCIYQKLHQLEADKPVTDTRLEEYFIKHKKDLDNFLESHAVFYRYYLDGSDHLDKQYFTRSGEHHNCLEWFMPFMDYDCITPYSVKIAIFDAYEFVKNYIDGVLQKLRDNEGLQDMPLIEQRNLKQKKVRFTGKQVRAVELILAFHANKCFNDGKVPLLQLFSYFEDSWGIEIPNPLRTIQDIINRKGGYTVQLDEMKIDTKEYLEKHYLK